MSRAGVSGVSNVDSSSEQSGQQELKMRRVVFHEYLLVEALDIFLSKSHSHSRSRD